MPASLIGIAGERHFEFVSGVDEGDQVIIGPFDRLRDLRDGDLVEVEDEDENAGSRRDNDR